MGQMEWDMLKSRKQEHEEMVAAIHDLERMGYMVSGISHKNGALEVICHPPEDADRKKLQEALKQGYGLDESSGHALSLDGISETFSS
jgi:hypothetical protein